MKKQFLFLLLSTISLGAYAQPVNDNPCNATSLTVGAVCNFSTYTNVAATATTAAGIPAPGCGSGGGLIHDVWFSVTVPAGGTVLLNSEVGTMTDGAMAVYSGTCQSMSLILCDDDGSGTGGLMPELSITGQTQGATLWVRFWGFDATDVGTFQLCASLPAANDNPCTAMQLSVGTTCTFSTFTNVGTTASGGVPAPGCGNFVATGTGASKDVWFVVSVPPGGAIHFDSEVGSMTNGSMAIYSGTACTSLALVACNADATSSSNGLMPELNVTGRTPGSLLWIRFWGTGSDVGTFQLCASLPPPPNVQDCPGAIPICQNVYSTTVSYSGTGSIGNEIDPVISCLATGERSDVWYTFTVQSSGLLNFTITPNDLFDDYDWAVYNLTTAPCSDIATNASINVSCNYSADPGITGPNGLGTTNSQPASGVRNNATIPVLAGQTYVVNVSNFTQSQSGYTIDFSASTAVIFDQVAPHLQTLNAPQGCTATELTVDFSENILCSTIQNPDFTVIGPDGPHAVTGWSATGCSSGAQYGRNVTISVNPPIHVSGSYAVCLTNAANSVTDLCGNVAAPACLTFTLNPIATSSTISACNIYTLPWGVAETNSGDYSHTYNSIRGCDSVVTIHLTINHSSITSLSASTCANVPYQLPWGGTGVQGANAHVYRSIGNCDSTVTITLTIDPVYQTTTLASTCANVPYQLPWGGTAVVGDNSHQYSSVVSGCDSIAHIILQINQGFVTPISVSTCSNDPYILPWGGAGVAGINSHLYQALNGCDSTVLIDLTIKPVYNSSSAASTCANQPYTLPWGGTGIAGINTHRYSALNGCDSTVTIDLSINPVYNTSTSVSSCSGQPYTLPWGGIGVPGPNTHVYTASNRCDSTVTITLSLGTISAPAVSVSPGISCRNNTIYIGYGPQFLTLTAIASGNFTYQWYKNGIAIPGATGSTYQATAGGVYSVVVMDGSGCTSSPSDPAATANIDAVDVRCGQNLNKVVLCHVPPGNPANAQTICIAPTAVPSHLSNHPGDCLGPCPTPLRMKKILSAVYPNPFSKEVNINFEIPETGHITVEVFDVDGRLVKSLFDGIAEEGDPYQVTFDGTSLSKGVYFIKLTGTDFSNYEKLIKY